MKALVKNACLFLFVLFIVINSNFSFSQSEPDEKKIMSFENELILEMDNMLNNWYVKKEISDKQQTISISDTVALLEAWNDDVLSTNMSKILTSIPLAYNSTVKKFIELYCVKRARYSAVMLGLAQYYFPAMQEIFDQLNVPEELVYLTIVESALNPQAVSRAGATGIWQFMHGTGKMYGLEVNTFVDDRRDPIKATYAAACYLKDLYAIFQDWGLAISAYNCGPGNVKKAIIRSNIKSNPDFWKVCNFLPNETRNYYPAFLGALYLIKYHSQHGIEAVDISIPFSVDTIMVNHEFHLNQIATMLNIDIDELKLLNPQYKKNVIPAYKTQYPLRLKVSDIPLFLALEDSIYCYKYDSLFSSLKMYEYVFTGYKDTNFVYEKIYYTVKKDETIRAVASKHNMSVYELKELNNLTSNSIYAKQRLIVGYKSTKKTDKVLAGANTAHDEKNFNVEKNSKTQIFYIVKKGDTMGSIAQKFKVSVKSLSNINKISNPNTIKTGMKLIITE